MSDKFIEQNRYDLPLEGEREKRKFPDSKEEIKIEPGSTYPTTAPTESINSTSTSNVSTTWSDNDIEKRLAFAGIKNLNDLIKKYAESYTLYVDMDGVLVDFNAGFERFGKGDPDSFKEQNGSAALYKLLQTKPHFFLDLAWMPDGEDLWNFIKQYNPIILTTPIHSLKFCKEDKTKWVKDHLGDGIQIIFETNKEKYASPTSILIDDRDKNIIPWEEANGIGIKHTSADKTIKELQKIYER